jgi:hypothetical protein
VERATLAWGYRGLTEIWKKGLARAQHAAGNLENRFVGISLRGVSATSM